MVTTTIDEEAKPIDCSPQSYSLQELGEATAPFIAMAPSLPPPLATPLFPDSQLFDERAHAKVEQSLEEAHHLAREMAEKWVECAKLALESARVASERSTAQWTAALTAKTQEAQGKADTATKAIALKLREAENVLNERPEVLATLMIDKLHEAVQIIEGATSEVNACIDEGKFTGAAWGVSVESALRAGFHEAQEVAVNKIEAIRAASEKHRPLEEQLKEIP